MTRMGVDISKPKTHVSLNTYEFAKRWIQNGKEISGLPMKGILNNRNDIKVLYTIIHDYLFKNHIVNPKPS
jgi:hypothetical protein